jgi:FixJ family two-component response regulator
VIFVVDDDADVRRSLASVLEANGFEVQTFESGDDLLSLDRIEGEGLLLDMQMPGSSGLDVLRELRSRNQLIPTIVLTGHGTITLAVEAMRIGARDFLEKPCASGDLLAVIGRSFTGDRIAADPDLASTIAALSPRRRQVLQGLMKGLQNKVIAYELGLSVRTVEHYRADLMNQLGVRSLPDLVRIGVAAGL